MARNSKRQYSYPLRNRGSILVVAVWVLAAFSILSAGLYGIVSSRLKLAQTLEGRITGRYLAKAACAYFKAQRAAGEKSLSTLYGLQAKETQKFDRCSFTYTLQDEGSKININTSSADTLARLPGFDKELAKKVFESKIRPFYVKEELLLVEDMTEEIFSNCKDLITVYGTGCVNINTATAQTMKILGMDEELTAVISGFRSGSDGKEGTSDDGVFESAADIINDLTAYSSLYESQEAKLIQLISQNVLGASSQCFVLNVETAILEKTMMRYNIVIDKDKIKRWEEF